MDDLVVTCAHTGATLATIDRIVNARGDQTAWATVGSGEDRTFKSFPVDPFSPAVATYRAQVWIESVLDGAE